MWYFFWRLTIDKERLVVKIIDHIQSIWQPLRHTLGVNFTNILRAAFAPIFLRQKKVQTLNLSTKKFCTKLLYEKAVRKMLAKLTLCPRSNYNYNPFLPSISLKSLVSDGYCCPAFYTTTTSLSENSFTTTPEKGEQRVNFTNILCAFFVWKFCAKLFCVCSKG